MIRFSEIQVSNLKKLGDIVENRGRIWDEAGIGWNDEEFEVWGAILILRVFLGNFQLRSKCFRLTYLLIFEVMLVVFVFFFSQWWSKWKVTKFSFFHISQVTLFMLVLTTCHSTIWFLVFHDRMYWVEFRWNNWAKLQIKDEFGFGFWSKLVRIRVERLFYRCVRIESYCC